MFHYLHHIKESLDFAVRKSEFRVEKALKGFILKFLIGREVNQHMNSRTSLEDDTYLNPKFKIILFRLHLSELFFTSWFLLVNSS